MAIIIDLGNLVLLPAVAIFLFFIIFAIHKLGKRPVGVLWSDVITKRHIMTYGEQQSDDNDGRCVQNSQHI